jgi:hypothetical protein
MTNIQQHKIQIQPNQKPQPQQPKTPCRENDVYLIMGG